MFFQRISDLRIDNDLSQQKLADILELNRETYQRYETGTREIPVWLLIKLSKFYDVSTDYILGLSDKKK